MRDYIRQRTLEVAAEIIKTSATIRQANKKFKCSKSTIHMDLKHRLPDIDPALAQQIMAIFENHKAERSINGGLATRKKYQMKK